MTPERHTLLAGIADEFLHNYPRGRRLLAIEGADAAAASAFADDLATVLSERGIPSSRAHSDADETTLRTELVAPFRAEKDDAVLLVDGRGLLGATVRGIWHFSVWLTAGDEPPHTAASALVDITDPAAPTRRFSDYCALPPGSLD